MNELILLVTVVACYVFGWVTSEYRYGWRLWLWITAWVIVGPVLVLSFAAGVSLLHQITH